ncbi:MAG: helix-turn-helix transcriptional regulator [Opitutae bacterium]|nr:helix-turn-helix transcriptional regulator [Opitutae bacterium]
MPHSAQSARRAPDPGEFFRIERSPARQVLDFRALDLSPVRLLGRYRYASAQQQLDVHSHGQMIEICYLESGQQTYEVDGQAYPLVGGDVFLTFPGEKHGSGRHPEARGVLYWLLISVSAARRSFLHLPKREGQLLLDRLLHPPKRCFAGRASLRHTLREIFAVHHDRGTPLFTVELRNLLTRFLLDVAASAHEQRTVVYSPDISRAIGHIHHHLEIPLPLAKLAREADLSLPRFKSKFKQEVGLPPADYILRCKIAQAAQWLYETKQTVTDIALRLGFSSSQYFATVFRRYTLHAPNEARAVRVYLS